MAEVLLIEDDPAIRSALLRALSGLGHGVGAVATAMAGLEALVADHPDVVVLDLGLPDLDGLEVCKRIRATSQIPIIFLTARDGEVDRVLGLELGADDYLTKPFSPAELETDDTIDLAVTSREEDHRDLRRGAQLLAHLQTVDGGQADVEHDEPGPVVLDGLQPGPSGACLEHPEALAGEVHVDEVGNVGLVVDDDDRPLLVVHDIHGFMPHPDAYLRDARRPSDTYQENIKRRGGSCGRSRPASGRSA
jgi:CheY-like chemotaxis protein